MNTCTPTRFHSVFPYLTGILRFLWRLWKHSIHLDWNFTVIYFILDSSRCAKPSFASCAPRAALSLTNLRRFALPAGAELLAMLRMGTEVALLTTGIAPTLSAFDCSHSCSIRSLFASSSTQQQAGKQADEIDKWRPRTMILEPIKKSWRCIGPRVPSSCENSHEPSTPSNRILVLKSVSDNRIVNPNTFCLPKRPDSCHKHRNSWYAPIS